MRLFIALAVFESCPADWLNDTGSQRATLEQAVTAGKFTRLEVVVVPFSPHGVTACAIVGESHLALHTWPEEGRLFVDIASCGSRENARQALAAIERALPQGHLETLQEYTIDPNKGSTTDRALPGRAGGRD